MSTVIKVSNMYGTTLSPEGAESLEIHLTPTLGLDTQVIQDAVDEAEASAAAALVSENNAAASEAAALASENAAASSESNAAASEAAALASENAAAASEAAALASENAAAASEANAATSESNASDSEAAALASENAAAASEAAARASELAAASSESNAATSETNAANSAAAALASENAAATSESNAASSAAAALASENAAATSESNAASSESNAATSETNAAASELAAANSEDAAQESETNAAASAASALASKNAAATSESNAASSESNAASSASSALSSKNAAAASEAAAATSEANAAVSETNAANSAQEAADSAAAAASALRPRGDWDASSGNFPIPTLVPDERADFYQISVGGTMTDSNPAQPDVTVAVGDQLYWHLENDIWYKIDNTDQVTSVAGKQGAVVLNKNDVGLNNVDNTSDANKPISTATQTALDRLEDDAVVNAGTVDGLNSTQFVRSDANDSVTGELSLTKKTRFTKAQTDGRDFTNASIKGAPSATTNATGYTTIALGSSTADNYGIGLSAHRKGTSANPDFVITHHNNSASGTEMLRMSDVSFTYKGNRVLTVADEGTGNGLDADTVDGQHASEFLNKSGDEMTGELRFPNDAVYERNFDMIENASPQYILLCKYAANQNVNGSIRLGRTSGHYQSAQLDIVVSSGTSELPYGTILSLQSTQEDEEYSLVVVTYNSTNYVAVKYEGNRYPTTGGATFSGQLQGDANSLQVFTSLDLTNEAPLRSNKKFEINGDTIWHGGNDGSGSGLDADTVDGIQASQFLRSDADDTTTGALTILKDTDYPLNLETGNNRGKVGIRFDGETLSQEGYFYATHKNADSGPSGEYSFHFDSTETITNVILDGAGNYYVQGNEVWHAGNDGSGSGLDADKLDGLDSSQFLRSDTSDTMTGTLNTQGINVDTNEGTTPFRLQRNNNGNTGQDDNVTMYVLDSAMYTVHNNDSDSDSSLFVWQYMSGGSAVDILSMSYTEFTYKGNTIWHQGNDGSGSGLDADLLDGIHASSFVRADQADNINARHRYTNTDSIKLPAGSTAQRTSSPEVGDIRFNSQDDGFEGYNSRGWGSIGGGGVPEYAVLFGANRYSFSGGSNYILINSGTSALAGDYVSFMHKFPTSAAFEDRTLLAPGTIGDKHVWYNGGALRIDPDVDMTVTLDGEVVTDGYTLPTDGVDRLLKIAFNESAAIAYIGGATGGTETVHGPIYDITIDIGGSVSFFPVNEGWTSATANIIDENANRTATGYNFTSSAWWGENDTSIDNGAGLLIETADGIEKEVELPSGVQPGDWFSIGQYGKALGTIRLTDSVYPIMGLFEDFIMDVDYQVFTFSYVDPLVGWKIVNAVGESEAPSAAKTVVEGTYSEGTDTFAITYDVGYVDVFVGGYKLANTEFNAADGTSVVLNTPLLRDSYVYIQGWNHVLPNETKAGVVTYDDSNTQLGASTAQEALEAVWQGKPNDNLLINGDFSVSQRDGANPVAIGSRYYLDRWVLTDAISAVGTIQQDRISYDSTTNATHWLKVATTSAGTFGLTQRIENTRPLSGKTATVSAWFSPDAFANTPTVYSILWNSTDGYGGNTPIETFVPTGEFDNYGWQKFTATYELPTLRNSRDADVGSFMTVGIQFDVGVSNFVGITNVKLELGSVATPFIPDDPQVNLAKCQRYYCKSLTRHIAGQDQVTGTYHLYSTINYPVHMRTAPNTGDGTLTWSLANTPAGYTTTTLSNATADGFYFDMVGSYTGSVVGSIHYVADVEL